MKFLLGFSLTLLLMISSPTAKAADSWTFYDDFNSKFLDIANWTGSERTNGGVTILEEVREIEGHRLYMRTRAYGPRWQEAGVNWYSGDNRLVFPTPYADLIRGIKASIKVNEVEVTQCPVVGVEQPTHARARITGHFFRTVDCSTDPTAYQCQGSNSMAGAQIRINRQSNSEDRPGLLRISAVVYECTDPSCFTSTLHFNENLGTIRVRQWATVSLEWDPDNYQFIFQLGKEPPQIYNYGGILDMYEATGTFKAIGTASRFPFCSESERQIALIGADFDKVYTK